MADGQYTATFHLTFPDERTRADFEIAFQAFVKEFQRQTLVYNLVRGAGVPAAGGGQGGGGVQGGGGQEGHSFGTPPGGTPPGGGQAQGLIRITTSSGASAYLNFI